jgi:poly(hydroxyalkanoate) depolymerase family esterase
MPRLGQTLAGLAALAKAGGSDAEIKSGLGLRSLTGFGSNPGALQARYFVPAASPAQAPLVIVLHGCTQTPDSYDQGSGWSRLAEENGFALLFPEQQRANNPNLCFNWFEAGDVSRDSGEALSIRQMIAAMIDRHDLDPSRVFVTGLSAGGAMTSALLATYPEVFAAGAIIAGLPFGAARTVGEAFARMRGNGYPKDSATGEEIRRAAPVPRHWPRVAVWQGSADMIVVPSNAARIVKQWQEVFGLSDAAVRVENVAGCCRQSWTDDAGMTVLESYLVPGMGHGVPLARGGDCGVPGPFMLEAGICSTRQIARFFDLLPAGQSVGTLPLPADTATVQTATRVGSGRARTTANPHVPAAAASGVGKIIEDALRAAGLMR